MSDRETCPNEIVAAGAAAFQVRCDLDHAAQRIGHAAEKLRAAGKYMKDNHDGYEMEIGGFLAALHNVGVAFGMLMDEHDKAARKLDEYKIARPTPAQIVAAIEADPGPVVNEGGR